MPSIRDENRLTDAERAAMAKVAKELEQTCKQRNITRNAIAFKAGKRESTICRLLSGETKQRKTAEKVLDEMGKRAGRDWRALFEAEMKTMAPGDASATVDERWAVFSTSLTDPMKEWFMQIPTVPHLCPAAS